ncbi:MAG: tRNA 4-thiouridine(8) synthase ThiI [Candidatus Bathyarchaeota archaeon]|nr:tRNA 4-thiouridine(8) synthase ThiI [Candidatus Bathyarchaeota archaeon]
MFNVVLVHYGELALKGLNRPHFEARLMENMRKALKGQSYSRIRRLRGRFIIELNEQSDAAAIEEALKRVFGISWFAFCRQANADINSIKEAVEESVDLHPAEAIKVSANRADKSLPFTSMDLNRMLGAHLVSKYGVKVSMKQPQKEIFIELFNGKAYIFTRKVRGLYGLPVGVSGRVLHLLSGGIDSPVAAWLLMKRGCSVDFLHFHAFERYNAEDNAKILELAKILRQYCFRARIFFTPFYPFEAEALEAPRHYRLILFRRFMVRVAEQIAQQHGVIALGTGENLAQVSSQTLENLAVIESATSMPILRPLLTWEKHEIVNLARQIGTFQVSIKPYRDCCSLFIAKHPATRAKRGEIEAVEAKLHINEAVKESVEKTELVKVC